MTVAAVGSLRCSSWARNVGLDPGGTAGAYDGFLVVDLPLPWPRDIGEVDEVAAIGDLLADLPGGLRLRVQGSVPSEDGRRRVALYLREEGRRFRRFSGSAVEVDERGVRSSVEALLAGEGAPVVGRELLVCTHGRRDICCGSLGTELHGLLAASPLPHDVHLARTSHTGGHRFAPTFILLPEGTVWAFADVDLVLRVLSRKGGLPGAAKAADHYRGCAGLAGPRAQVLEREVLREVGWDLLSSARSGYETGDGLVRLEVEMGGAGEGAVAGGSVEVWEAAVVPGRTLPVPDCGRPIEEAKKSETEWEVRDLRRV
ncbi:MAG TPA: sucrase ferredoxin [Acidimicrobiales bacterium]|nr:sucrase ferredoxin [Acidimicrobiales bacterium]